MNTQRRIDDFQGSLSEYVAYLETKVYQLTKNYSPPSSPQLDVHDGATHNSDDEVSTPRIRFIRYEPDTLTRPAKKQRTIKPRWQREMDDMLCDLPSGEDWLSKREAVGLSSWKQVLAAFDIIIYGTALPLEPITGAAVPESADATLQLLHRYASSVAALDSTTFTIQVTRFCKLVFVSLCCVLVYHGVERSLVDNVMKVCISESDSKNLDILRRGASWANRMISTLAADGLRHLASEAFVLCGRSISSYGRFGDAGKDGFEYFRKEVLLTRHKNSELEAQAFLPFYIPFFIKTIVGEIYSLSDICTALRYVPELGADDYSSWLEFYRYRELPFPQGASDSFDGRRIARQAEAPADNFDSMQMLLTAAEQSGSLPEPSSQLQLGTDGRDTLTFEEIFDNFEWEPIHDGC